MTMWPPQDLPPGMPKYRALANAITDAVATGALRQGDRLPPQRQLADRLGVTTGTVTRAYAEAEHLGLLEGRVGSGTYVRGEVAAESGFRIQPTSGTSLDLGFTLALPDHQLRDLGETLRDLSNQPALLSELLAFAPETGLERHRLAARDWLVEYGVHCHADEVMLCSGGQNGLFTALHTLCETGDTVLSDGLTYSGFVLAARHLRLRHVGLPMDEDGLLPDEFRTACERYRPRLLYLMPQLHNPTGMQMSQARKKVILELCERYNVMVVEDDVQSVLVSERSQPMVSLMPDRVIHIASPSKCFAGGPRIGFMVIPLAWHTRFRLALRVSSWMVSPLLGEIVTRWLNSPDRSASLQRQRAEARARHDLVRTALSTHRYQAHPESLNGWLALPAPWRAGSFQHAALRAGIELKSAEVFAAGHYQAPQAVRLCVGAPASRAELARAATILADILARPEAESSWLNASTN